MIVAENFETTEALNSPVLYGPLPEAALLSAGLDYYKPTMSQLEYEQHPEAEVTFTFKNRSDKRLADYVDVDALQARLDLLRATGWTAKETDYLGSLRNSQDQPVFSNDYLTMLMESQLPPVDVRIDETTNDLAIDTTGPWQLVTFWETIVMSEVNEAYFEGMVTAQNLDLMEIYREGDRRLSQKIEFFQANPDIKFADFGTRRRFSLRWHEHVVERLATECPDNFIGTSNVALAAKLGIKPIGTFAHELPMVYAAIADARGEDIRDSHRTMIDDWFNCYGDDLSTALSDTFGTDFFFESLTLEQAVKLRGTRQDSGDPIAYGHKTIQFYEQHHIDPTTKGVTFSDNLNSTEKVARIHKIFKGRIGHLFGIGTFFTNDLGLEPGNNVMKATRVKLPTGQQADTVKLSEDKTKHTGPAGQVARYEVIFGTNQEAAA